MGIISIECECGNSQDLDLNKKLRFGRTVQGNMEEVQLIYNGRSATDRTAISFLNLLYVIFLFNSEKLFALSFLSGAFQLFSTRSPLAT